MRKTTEELYAKIRELMEGHTDRDDEAEILAILDEADTAQLNELMLRIDLGQLISDVDDRIFGPDNRTNLYDLLVGRLAELSVDVRVVLINALQKGLTDKQEEKVIRDVFLGTFDSSLTALKNGIDAGGDYRDLQQLVHTDIDSSGIRGEMLAHIEREAGKNPLQAIKLLSDIDDTFYAYLKDQRYPRGTIYPGVNQYYKELIRGPNDSSNQVGNLVFLTGRPKVRSGTIEDFTHDSLRKRGIAEATILSGDFAHLIGNEKFAEKKYENFLEYKQLFPEYGFVFTGDSGQGDAIFGKKIQSEFPKEVRGVFIHRVVPASPNENEGVIFFDTYVGAAAEAFKVKLISKIGLQRVIDVARKELKAVEFSNDSQKQEREADLERDADAALQLS